jgi:hypothetical protein
MTRKFLFLLLLTIGVAELAVAQSFYNIRRNRNLMVNVGSGTANYKGEMVNPGEFGILKPNITVGAEYYFMPRISARAQFTWFQIKGDDSKADDDRKLRNLNFTSSCFELSTVGIISLGPQGARYYERPRLNLHGFAGIGLLYFNPKTTLDGEKYALQPLQTEGVSYSRIQPVIPIGIGARLHVNPFVNILIEGGYRITFTDHLDDVSRQRYLHYSEFEGGQSSVAWRLSDRRNEQENVFIDPERASEVGIRGNPSENDGYFILNISLQYYLPSEIFRSSQRKLYTIKRKSYYRKPKQRR